ncbi:MAG TPA: phosphoadenylyl-sulfate reductase [Thermohalobaculum sp.]|nr:phosphoadenylyl-sulfate reductase [Thermohalobaculum sp.]
MSARSDAAVLNRLHRHARAADLLVDVIRDQFPGAVALVSSFGADSAVLLHMASRIDPAVPVLFLETGMLFPETLDYQRALAARLGLRDVRLIRPDAEELAADDPDATLHAENTDGCCFLRKTLPLRRALRPFRAWITGRKRFQATSRAGLELFEEDDRGGRLKVNPLAGWSAADVRAYVDTHALPRHPLVDRGYPSIGCAPCTSAVRPGESDRAGRWRGSEKVECGIHFAADGTIRRAAP